MQFSEKCIADLRANANFRRSNGGWGCVFLAVSSERGKVEKNPEIVGLVTLREDFSRTTELKTLGLVLIDV